LDPSVARALVTVARRLVDDASPSEFGVLLGFRREPLGAECSGVEVVLLETPSGVPT